MKKRYIVVPLAACVLAAAVLPALFGRTRPFRDLEAGDIRSASVFLSPPGETVPIPDTAALAELLQNVIVYRRDDSYTEYAGQGVTFTLTLSGGTRREVTAYNPFLVIDGAGYRTEYGPCEALNAYANELLRNH